MPNDRSFTLCARCHRKIAGRPASFKQVVLEQHVEVKVEGKVCLECHDPHSPKL
jgi:recombinational DNA repair protein (RecF pathway)